MLKQRLDAALATVLAPVLGDDVSVDDLRTLTGGASRTTWAFTARTARGLHALILQTGPPDWGHLPLAGAVHAGMELEARVQALAAAAGAPVPHILVADDSPAALGNPFLICQEIAGQTIARKIARGLDETGRAALLQQCAEALARIHRADPAGADLDQQDQLTEWRSRLDDMHDTTATLEWAFRWLAAHRPPASTTRLVHGDFRMGNLIVDGARLAAVLDWELVHAGDAYEDLAWFCIRAWRFGAPEHLGAGGLGSVESFLCAYERASGTTVDRVRFRWWLILATLRWGVICRYQAERHLSGQTPSVELAAIGRRVCETEWDLLDLLDRGLGAPPACGGERSDRGERHRVRPPVTALHGRPTAAELVAAVADFLEADVRPATTGQVNFHARVAANVLRTVERELTDDSAADVAAELVEFGFADEAQLAAAVRCGQLDERTGALPALLRRLVRHRLAIAHPGYDQSTP
ncbi:MAG: aminoglycoside phosphotransferase [Mycobacterium sp.]|nr:aminoglycoside phosphotransferase [Mycobacterium sp.]